MGTVSTSLPSDGQTIDAADVNTPFNAILAEFNGNIDNDNIKTGANISGAKLGAATTPLSVLDTDGRAGWITGVLAAPNTITYNGNRSYDVVFNSVDYTDELSEGMRLRLTRTVSAPTQCADLEASSSQYFSSASAGLAGMTFTDDFVVSAWVKLESYKDNLIASRYNGTSGWQFYSSSDGTVYLQGYNAGSTNTSYVKSYQSLPLNKWVHVTAQLDMSAFTATTTTSYVMIDGVDVPATVARGGTNPTAIVQAGDLQIGAGNTLNYFDGKIAQVAIFNAKVTQATMRTYMSQGLSGSETSLVSAYSCSNSLLDLNTTNNNDLTANGGALMTNVDSPFGNYLGGTLEYGIITKTAFSTNTTLTVQVPEGCAIPTSGGVSAVAYSTQAVPYLFPRDKSRWKIELQISASIATSGTSTSTVYNPGGINLNVPIGSWSIDTNLAVYSATSASTTQLYTGLSTSSSVFVGGSRLAGPIIVQQANSSIGQMYSVYYSDEISLTSATPYYILLLTANAVSSMNISGNTSTTNPQSSTIRVVPTYL